MRYQIRNSGFTLIELSIVLVIIGLIVGGVLVGRDLIAAAEVRAQISQLDKYSTAVNTFRAKYNCLPGDCSNAANFGFAARGQYAGEGDGNGLFEGVSADAPNSNSGSYQGTGENAVVWVDLTAANLLDGAFNTASETVVPGSNISGTAIDAYMPRAKLGRSGHVYVYSASGLNYFGISGDITINEGGIQSGQLTSGPSITVQQAFSIDQKLDDGLPFTGSVTAGYLTNVITICSGGCPPGFPATPTSCYDDGSATTTVHYSMEVNGGAGINCGLTARVQ